MTNIQSEVEKHKQELPTHGDIEKRAYDLYLKTGEEFSPTVYWLIAEEQLRKEQANRREPTAVKTKK